MKARKIVVGSYGRKVMPHSEVCMHMRVADKPMKFKLRSINSVQLYRDDGSEFSGPITTGEAGVFVTKTIGQNGEEWVCYYYPDEHLDGDLFDHPDNNKNEVYTV